MIVAMLVRTIALAVLVGLSCVSCVEARVTISTPSPTSTTAPTLPAAVSTSAPSTSPLPRAFKVGEAITFQDGLRLTALKVETTVAAGCFPPDAGNRRVVVVARFDNGSPATFAFNLYDFRIGDSTGVRRAPTLGGCRDDRLDVSGDVVPGAFVTGAIVFELPSAASQLQLIWQHSGYAQTTIDLS